MEDVAVIGLPDDEWGECIVAVIVSHSQPAIDELKQLVRGRLRSTHMPEDIIFRSELPYNETGKLLRRVLKAELAFCSGLSASGLVLTSEEYNSERIRRDNFRMRTEL